MSFSPGTTPQLEQLYRGQPNITRYPAGSNSQLVYCPLTGDTQMLPNLSVKLVERCQTFATLDQHAMRLCNELGYGPLHVRATRKLLAELAETGLLVSHEALCRRLSDSRPLQEDPVPPIASVGIPTRNRPADLERCLRSYAECSRLYEREMKFLVADQSDEAQMRQTNVQMLRRLQTEFGVEVFYAGLNEKKEFVAGLAAHCGIAPELVNFALVNDEKCSVDTGINRNALQLSSLDQLTVQIDDDSVCRVASCPESLMGLALETRYSVAEFWFPTEEEVKTLGNEYTIEDFFALHEKLLGQPLVECIDRCADGDLKLDGASADFFYKSKRYQARVFATSLGVGGESGVGSSIDYLDLNEKQRSRLLRSEADYHYSMFNHQVIRGVTRATISDVAFCGGFNLGLDNRQILPPFLPVQRSEDIVFSSLIHSCSALGYIGFLPQTILHKRPSSWQFTKEELRKGTIYKSTGAIIEILIRELTPKPDRGDATANMIALGTSLKEWGSVPLADFEEMLRILLWKKLAYRSARLQKQLAVHGGQPRYWADDLNMVLSWLSEGFTDENLIVAADLAEVFSVEEARRLLQRLIRRFGELLEVWSDLRNAARELQSRGVCLARKI